MLCGVVLAGAVAAGVAAFLVFAGCCAVDLDGAASWAAAAPGFVMLAKSNAARLSRIVLPDIEIASLLGRRIPEDRGILFRTAPGVISGVRVALRKGAAKTVIGLKNLWCRRILAGIIRGPLARGRS